MGAFNYIFLNKLLMDEFIIRMFNQINIQMKRLRKYINIDPFFIIEFGFKKFLLEFRVGSQFS